MLVLLDFLLKWMNQSCEWAFLNPLSSDLQVHGHHPSVEAPPVGQGHHGSHYLHLEFSSGSGLPSLLLLHHPRFAPQDPLLRGLASQGRWLLHVSVTAQSSPTQLVWLKGRAHIAGGLFTAPFKLCSLFKVSAPILGPLLTLLHGS